MEKDILFYQKEAIKHLEAYKKDKIIPIPLPQNYLFDQYISASMIYIFDKKDLTRVIASFNATKTYLYKNGIVAKDLLLPGWFVVLYYQLPYPYSKEWKKIIEVYPLKEYFEKIHELRIALKTLVGEKNDK